MTTEIECTIHPEGHSIPTGGILKGLLCLLGRSIVDHTDDDGMVSVYESDRDFNPVKRIKIDETLSGTKAKLPNAIKSISVTK